MATEQKRHNQRQTKQHYHKPPLETYLSLEPSPAYPDI